jgi:3-isopropylmalate/(R)-2-methylmalate dehydratase small subunit
MEKFDTLESLAAPLRLPNIDTDVISPMAGLTGAGSDGIFDALTTYAFAPLRYADGDVEAGVPNPDFVLNKPEFAGAKILLTGDNFGCGSSRETAPAGIRALGIRCLIGTSFGEIFFGNCFQRGILPIRFTPDQLETCASLAGFGIFFVDLLEQHVRLPNGECFDFEVDPYRKHCLLNGLDDLSSTMERIEQIRSYQMADAQVRPWIY